MTIWNDLEQLNSSPYGSRKQGTTHIPVTAEQVLQSDGEERFKWMCAGRKELDNLTSTGTIECISPEGPRQDQSRSQSLWQEVCIKPDKYKVRIVACGKQDP